MENLVSSLHCSPSRRVLVTGASRGIGRAIAEIYFRHGWQVETPSRADLDLSDIESIERYFTVPREFDALINNAGENHIRSLDQVGLAEWERSLTVNLTGPFLLIQRCGILMRKRRWGRIINVSSIFGLVSRAGRAPYTAAKTGLIGLTRNAAIEWGPDNVLVNAICPGYIETDLTRQNNTPEQMVGLAAGLPLRRLGHPDEVARAVYFLGSDENSFITGQTLLVDGGFTAQ